MHYHCCKISCKLPVLFSVNIITGGRSEGGREGLREGVREGGREGGIGREGGKE